MRIFVNPQIHKINYIFILNLAHTLFYSVDNGSI